MPTPENSAAGGPATFRTVLEAEWAEIRERRRAWETDEDRLAGEAEVAPDPHRPPPDLVGLALSGGGIRSATFALGLLQGMAEKRVLPSVDYLSTVSGGGYAGGWWSAWLSREGRSKRDVFPPDEQIEAQRWDERSDPSATAFPGRPGAAAETGSTTAGGDRRQSADSAEGAAPPPDASLSARQRDPIHHLRLFANYLTPRKGLLSADSWRGATVVTRNLALTWLVLLPVLLATVVAGQVYFTFAVDPEDNFVREFPVAEVPAPVADARLNPPADAAADAQAIERAMQEARELAAADARRERLAAIGERAAAAARPVVVLFLWVVLLTLVWMVHGSRGGFWTLIATVGGAAVAGWIGWTVYAAISPGGGGGLLTPGWVFLLAVGSVGLLVACRALPLSILDPRPDGVAAKAPPEDLLRNRVVRAHGAILVAMVTLTIVFAIAGFSHDLTWFLFDPNSGGPLPTRVKQAGGWGAVLATVGAMLFTGFMGAPAGGDQQTRSRPRLPSRMVFAAAPVLTIVLLAVLAAMTGRWLIRGLGDPLVSWSQLDWATGGAIALLLAFATYEVYDSAGGERPPLFSRHAIPPAAAVTVAGLVVLSFRLVGSAAEALVLWQVVVWIAAAWVLLIAGFRAVGKLEDAGVAGPRRSGWISGMVSGGGGHVRMGALLFVVAVGGWVVWLLATPAIGGVQHVAFRGASGGYGFGTAGVMSPPVLLGLALACGIFAAAERRFVPSERRRSLALVTVALAALSFLAVLPFLPFDAATIRYASAAVMVMVLALAWVVGLGWMANPNMLSLHGFYRARLVRAYLGASNVNRSSETITESADGDDLPLRSLGNCHVGAPYQLINTTLNLVAGRDLATAQRSAESFLMSRLYCGSARTGYRSTREYMNGTLTLGTAVAISGAAASPNMGSQTPTAALSMLLALLNVRLAFWAPTPNRPFWRDARVRLWPFYVLRELLSQTNEVSAYCCLSDGGHFDNTGLYALVSRGCKYIVLSDCGADPQPCFADLGNAIRRCRIDFGAEIDLRIDPFIPSHTPGAAAHFVIGTIRYSRAHAAALGWPEPLTDEDLQGTVIWMKPSLTLSDEPADLRQYALQNPVFPQQPTSDQWYDEAQFESYRRLGMHTAEQVFASATFPSTPSGVRAAFSQVAHPVETLRRTHFNIDVTTADGRSVLQIVELSSATQGSVTTGAVSPHSADRPPPDTRS